MKKLALISAIALAPGFASAAPKSAEFSAGFCAGWNEAAKAEQVRIANWRALVTAPLADPKYAESDIGKHTRLMSESISLYVTMQTLPPNVVLQLSGEPGADTVQCPPAPETPKPEAAK